MNASARVVKVSFKEQMLLAREEAIMHHREPPAGRKGL
jgi:hypothetical protein